MQTRSMPYSLISLVLVPSYLCSLTYCWLNRSHSISLSSKIKCPTKGKATRPLNYWYVYFSLINVFDNGVRTQLYSSCPGLSRSLISSQLFRPLLGPHRHFFHSQLTMSSERFKKWTGFSSLFCILFFFVIFKLRVTQCDVFLIVRRHFS